MIDLRTAIEKLGRNNFGFASAQRTGQSVVRIRNKRTGDLTFQSGHWSHTFPGLCGTETYPWYRHSTSTSPVPIPYVPEEARDVVGGDLRNQFILWEQAWNERAERERMHLDPALIEPVVGNLYIVHAVWDLTPLERAALGG